MIESDVLRLNDMSVGELKEMWRQYFDSEPIWKTKRFLHSEARLSDAGTGVWWRASAC